MSTHNHPIEQEELMAYLDGELATSRAVAAAAHLEHCAECQHLAVELRQLSQELMAWEVEQIEDSGISDEIVAVLNARKEEPKKFNRRLGWRTLLTGRGLSWASGSAFLFLLILAVSIPNLLRSGPGANDSARIARQRAEVAKNAENQFINGSGGNGDQLRSSDAVTTGLITPDKAPGLRGRAGAGTAGKLTNESEEGDDEFDTSDREAPTVPMIARVAGLTITTKEFDKTRAGLEEILKRHNGYMGELKVSAPADAGRTLTATLRIPAGQLEAALAELKKLGQVEDESQGGEEVTQQYVDLQARLANGKHTEQRLTEILRTRKLQDVLKVELEIDRVRGEIEQMQAEEKELTKRVAFATLNATVKEEYHAKLQGAPASTGSRFRNAAVDGYNTVVEGLIDVGLFLLSAGPSLLLWAAILFFPARWAWKKFRSTRQRGDAEEETV
ncbi:MAG TPA: DUF4349 domain-containing protein [Candidatus Angelobacter sp.]|jgi:hypothetical protein